MKWSHQLNGFLLLAVMSLSGTAVGTEYELKVDGLACPFCAYGIEKQLSKLEGVEHTDVDVGNGHVRVVVKEGAVLDESAAREAVKKAGFTLRAFQPGDEDR